MHDFEEMAEDQTASMSNFLTTNWRHQ